MVGGGGVPEIEDGRALLEEAQLLFEDEEERPPNEKLDKSARPDERDEVREEIENEEEEEMEVFRECDRWWRWLGRWDCDTMEPAGGSPPPSLKASSLCLTARSSWPELRAVIVVILKLRKVCQGGASQG